MGRTPSTLSTGVVIEGYQIEGILGEGGMGVVYEATQLSLDRKVALKLIASELSDDFEFRNRFEREGRIQAAIDHPHIVTVYEAGESKYGLFIAMRLIRGSTLKGLILAREVDAARALRILGQVADALDTAHEAGLVHRDVKPQNILVSRQRDHGYLADFGVMKSRGGTNLTRAGQIVGTIDYMAPEQIRGEPATQASDIYGLAAVLYESLVGTVPYPKNSDVAVIYAHLSDPPPKLTDVRPELPRALDEVIARAMAKDPAQRYPTAVAMVAAADEALGTAARAAIHIPAPVEKPEDIGIRRPEGAVTTAAARDADTYEVGQPTLAADGPPSGAVAPPTVVGSEDAAAAAPPTVLSAQDAAAAAAPPTVLGAQAGAPASPPTVLGRQDAPAPPSEPVAAAPPPVAPPPERPARRSIALPLLIGAALLVAGLAAVGFIVGHSGSKSADASTQTQTQTAKLSSGAITVSPVAGWSKVAAPNIPGLHLTSAAASGPPSASAGRYVQGQANGQWPSYLPASFVAQLKSKSPVSQPKLVKIDAKQAFCYEGLSVKGLSQPANVCVVPQKAGTQTLVCVVGSSTYAARCQSVVTTARIKGSSYVLAPSSAYASAITRAVKSASSGRASGLSAMKKAKTPSKEAKAASSVASSYQAASQSAGRASTSPYVDPANKKVVSAFAAAATAYKQLASAASAKSNSRYATAKKNVSQAEKQVENALAGLEQIGYAVSK